MEAVPFGEAIVRVQTGSIAERIGSFLAELKVFRILFCRYRFFREGNKMKNRLDISAIPELRTSVGMHGSQKQKEVAGPICLGVVIAILMAL